MFQNLYGYIEGFTLREIFMTSKDEVLILLIDVDCNPEVFPVPRVDGYSSVRVVYA